jgi:hypothetical protein
VIADRTAAILANQLGVVFGFGQTVSSFQMRVAGLVILLR